MKKITNIKLLSLIICTLILLCMSACTATPEESTGGSDSTSSTENELPSLEDSESDGQETGESESHTSTDTESLSETESNTEPQSETESQSESDSETDSETETEIGTETGSESEGETEPDISGIDYSDGSNVTGAGAFFADGAFALEEHSIDKTSAMVMSASDMLSLLTDKDNVTDKATGKVYRVTETLYLSASTSYYGNFSAIIAEGGIVIDGCDNVIVKDLIINGNITIKDSSGITFYKVDIKSSGSAISADAKSSKIKLDDCIIEATETAIDSKADELFVLGSVISSGKGIVSSGDEIEVQNTKITAGSHGISSSGEYCTFKNNTVESTNKDAVGISLEKGSYNGLVALNSIKGIRNSVNVSEGYNCVVLLNSAIIVTAEKNTNIYIVKNSLGGAVILRNNEYLLCDDNSFLSDGLLHPVINTENSQYNGDGLHALSARPEHGANEDILPHTNKDLFIDMIRESKVRDISLDNSYSYNDYIRTLSASGGAVIVPPGAYSISSQLELTSAHSGATIYAYGVYQEKKAVPNGADTPNTPVYDSMGKLIEISGANIHIHGLTFGYDFQSSGQVYVLEKFVENKKNYVRVVTSAGYFDGFSYENLEWFSSQATAIKGDMIHSWTNDFTHKFVRRDSDGTMIFEISADYDIYKMIEPGDIFGCRMQGSNNSSLSLTGSNTLLKDCVLYGYSAALAVYSGGENAKGITLERFHNTVHSSPIIDKETYDRYKELEKKYGLTSDGKAPTEEGAQGLEVYMDSQRRYRGGLPRLGSVDGTHVVGAAEGLTLTSCIFEQMVDDGSNHRSSSSRIAGVYDNGDGSTTIYYKGLVSSVYYFTNVNNGVKTGTVANTATFRKGDRMFAYASDGHVLIDAEVTGTAALAGALPSNAHLAHTDADSDCICDFNGCNVRLCYDNSDNETQEVKRDCKCDKCGSAVHSDYEMREYIQGMGDGVCNTCKQVLADSDSDGFNDSDNAFIIRSMVSDISYNSSNSTITFKIYSHNSMGVPYLISYSTQLRAVKVKTQDVNFGALEGYDLCDNEYFWKNKITCDNISLNSAGMTADNVVYRNFHCRGVLPRTVDVTVKNCTFRNVAAAGVLAYNDGTWGEATLTRNLTVEGCLFDNAGYAYGLQNDLLYAPITVGSPNSSPSGNVELNEDTLPCRDIKIIGNKFVNMNNNYAISINGVQNITIKGNVFTGRESVPTTSRAIYLNGCLNIEISDNTYNGFGDKTFDKLIVGWNYKNLYGTDLEGTSVPSEKGPMPTY